MRYFSKQILLLLAFSVVITACATPTTRPVDVSDVAAEVEAKKQREIALDTWFRERNRLVDLAYGIYRSSSPLCDDRLTHSIGIIAANEYSFSEEMREAAFSLYGVSNILKIIHVMRDSVAERAGLRVDDVPLMVNDWKVPLGQEAAKGFVKQLKETMEEGNSFTLSYLRDGIEKTAVISPERICDYKIALSNDDAVNAFADGETVIITRGMMRFVENDTELALVVSHELAHNAMEHMKAKKQNYVLGSILDIIAAVYGVNTQGTFGSLAAQAYSKEFEAEADYVGLYMMSLANLDITEAPKFWRRLAAIHPGNISSNFTATHPASAHRFVALEKTVQEIEGKKAAGLPLRPEMKKDQ